LSCIVDALKKPQINGISKRNNSFVAILDQGLLDLEGSMWTVLIVGAGAAITRHKVNGDAGWVKPATIADISAGGGDEIEFTWSSGFHDVVQLTSEADFNSCDTSSGTTLTPAASSGNYVFENVQLGGSPYFFVCSVGSHCSEGQKVKVVVTALEEGMIGITSVSEPTNSDDLVCSEGVRSGVCAECTCPSGSALIADAADTQGSDSGTCCEAAGTDAPTPVPTAATATTAQPPPDESGADSVLVALGVLAVLH
jgi:plastocyanin